MSERREAQTLTESQLRHRMLGAIFWLLLVVWWVPTWYGHPVNFQPKSAPSEEQNAAVASEQPVAQIASKAYQLPTQPDKHSSPSSTQAKPKPTVRQAESVKKQTPITHRESHNKTEPVREKKAQKKEKLASQKTAAQQVLRQKEANEESLTDLDISLSKKSGWLIRVASLSSSNQANELLGRLQDEGYEGYLLPSSQENYWVVFIGTFPSKVAAQRVKRKIDKKFYVKSLVFYRKPVSSRDGVR